MLKRRLTLLAAAAAVALPVLLTGATPASADDLRNQDMVNKMDGSRLQAGSTNDGTNVYSARGTARDNALVEAWGFSGTWDPVVRTFTGTLMTKTREQVPAARGCHTDSAW